MIHSEVVVKLIQERNVKMFAEVGVYKCKTLRYVFSTCPSIIQYWAIDPWIKLSGLEHGRMGRASTTQESWDHGYYFACELMVKHKNLRVMRQESEVAAAIFPDQFFDFVYVDALHDYDNCLKDIKVWLPKVKKGGIIGGDDYYEKPVRHFRVADAVKDTFSKDDIVLDEAHVWYVKV